VNADLSPVNITSKEKAWHRAPFRVELRAEQHHAAAYRIE
jgi:hypothetical protein